MIFSFLIYLALLFVTLSSVGWGIHCSRLLPQTKPETKQLTTASHRERQCCNEPKFPNERTPCTEAKGPKILESHKSSYY
uniref:Putative secreted protein n=1 Tax=Anopheles darlingi TaxID=43151 RepID=A0A2M4DL26_ANODA